ncbi:hypothetical protein RGAI101_2468 [Roseobacter sp. GAI101]|nr:hypothetical protein RGAI101_2468 [Roseobacter sp. GAI101]
MGRAVAGNNFAQDAGSGWKPWVPKTKERLKRAQNRGTT